MWGVVFFVVVERNGISGQRKKEKNINIIPKRVHLIWRNAES